MEWQLADLTGPRLAIVTERIIHTPLSQMKG
jgi:hypothetical protein